LTAVKGALEGVNLGVVSTFEDAEDFMRWLGERRPVLAWDTETTGLNPWDDDAEIRLMQLGDAMMGWAIPWQRWAGLVHEAMARYSGPIVAHNVAFDAKYTAVKAPDFPIPWDRLHDTMIMARIAAPTRPAGLKPLAKALIDPHADVLQHALNSAMATNNWTFATVPFDFNEYWLYGAMDTVLTARLWEIFKPEMDAHREVYDLEMAVRRVCTGMELRGFRVDLEYSRMMYERLGAYVEEMKNYGRERYSIDIGSTRQLADYLTEQGAHIDKRTPSGAPCVDKTVLKYLSIDGWTLADEVLNARKAEKLAGTYFKNFVGFARDGVLHPDINTLAARTSRMSITKPALQTLNKNEATVRDAFIPRDPENEVLVTCDSDQIEARLFANFSADPAFMAAFGGPEDFFVNIARQVYQDATLQKADKRRQIIKNYMYGRMYGAGRAKLALTAGVPLTVINKVQDRIDAEYPGISEFQTKITGLAEVDGRITTPMGRELVIDSTEKAYVAVNYVVQGHAAELLKLSIVNADNAGLGDFMCVPVHDELVLSVPRAEAEDAKRTLEDCMTFEGELYPVPITASAEGPFARWGDKLRGT
jgi:DNA polymerase-1